MRIFFKFFWLGLFCVALLIGVAYYWIHKPLSDTDSKSRKQSNPMELVVESGDSAQIIGKKLEELSLRTGPASFSFFSRLFGLHKDLKTGVYHIRDGESIASILTRISKGEGIHASITLIEGWTFEEVMNAIQKHPHIKKTLAVDDIESLSKALALEMSVDTPSIEGWIFPDTYFFQYGASDQQLLRRAVWLQKKTLLEIWESRGANSKLLTAADALNLASIIEKETQHPPDRTLVSGVFHNRLAMKMRLQSDPTIIYGLGNRFDGNLKKRHLRQDSNYNSYLRVGLPPTPISNPGKDALIAAVRPAVTDALYFVAKGDGSSYFSKTYRDHTKAVNYYQRGIGKAPKEKIRGKR
tara:strand:- start:1850 stop:2911 length:1062 start_codon:yes stop_codon:yes gene_type:complete